MPAAKQALGWVEEKLRRVFNLAGPIGVDLDPIVKPVVIVDDLRSPGHAFYQGRGWAVTQLEDTPGRALGYYSSYTKFLDDVLIQGFWIAGQVTCYLQIFYITPEEMTLSPPGGVVSTFLKGAWRDRKTGGTTTPFPSHEDQPPVVGPITFTGPAAGGFSPTPGNTLFSIGNTQGVGFVPVPAHIPMEIFVGRGGGIGYGANTYGAATTLGTFNFGLYGRVFPQ